MRMRYLCLGLWGLVLSATAGEYKWVELGVDNARLARAIVPADRPCPSITVDNTTHPMRLRAKADSQFPVISCEYPLPVHAKRVVIDGEKMALPPKQLARIAIIGDTGCRIQYLDVQACNDPAKWPFEKIATHIATHVKPDLVIHVGDYHYRETACPFWEQGCKNSPSGYGWDTWEADFFKPAKPLLASATWIMVRGNHENCKRANAGWRRFLDPYPMSEGCVVSAPAYTVKTGGQQFIVLDSSGRQKFRTVNSDGSAWVLVHHPFILKDPSPSIKAIFSGHEHVIAWHGSSPVQVIVGNSGSSLYKLKHSNRDFSVSEFGYMLATRHDDKWLLTAHRMDGSVIKHLEIPA